MVSLCYTDRIMLVPRAEMFYF